MLRTVEAVIDEYGNVRLLEALQLPTARKALVTILMEAELLRKNVTPAQEPGQGGGNLYS